MIPKKTLDIKSAIITLKVLKNKHLGLMDQSGAVRIIDTSSYKTIDGFKTNITQERTWGNHLSLSVSGDYAATIIPNSNKAVVYDIKQRKLLYTTARHKGDVESVCIDDENHYFVTGGTDGKTYVWNLKTGRMSYSFPPRSDYITDVDINSSWVASASYDKVIAVLNLGTMNNPLLLKGHSSVVTQMKILKGMKLLSTDKEGHILLWDLQTAKLLHRFNKMHDEITCFTLSEDEQFLFVGTKLGYVCLYDLDKRVELKKNYLKLNTKITAMALLNDELVIGTSLGKLNFYALILDEKKLMGLLKEKAYAVLYDNVEQNPLLRYSNVYTTLEKLYEDAIKKACLLLEKDQTSAAKLILEPFAFVKSKQSEVQHLFNDFREFRKFKSQVQEKRYSLAYALANQFKQFKQSSYYKLMEQEWRTSFNKAKSLAKDKDGEEKVKRILSNFKGISSKSTLIQQLFEQRTAYMLFRKKLAQKDFLALIALIKKCPFVKEFDEYDMLMEYADNIFIKAQQAMEKREYSKAVKYAKELLPFPDLKEDAQVMIKEADVLETFEQAFDNDDMNSMYKMITQYPYLAELSEAQALESDWKYHLELAQKYAAKADVVNAAESLEDFFEIRSKHQSISVVMQEAYIMQIQRALRSDRSVETIDRAVKQYVLFFGINDHIEHFDEMFKKKHPNSTSLSQLQKGNASLFRPSMIIEDIIKQ